MRTICALILLGATATAQIVRPVQHTNGVVVSPTNFWSADAARARSALGLGWSALTNTNSASFRTAIGVGTANEVTFQTVSASFVVAVSGLDGTAIAPTGVQFNGVAAATTRTNIGLGLPALTNTNNANFLAAIGALGTNGSAAGLTNFPSVVLMTNSGLTLFPAGLLRTNGSAAGLTNFPTLNQNTTGTAGNVSGVVALANGGTGATNASGARTALELGATWLTNTNVVDFRAAIGLAGSGFASFNSGSLGNSASGEYAATVGGALNTASGNYSFAAGRNAKATNQGAFVWADSQIGNFSSSNANSFNVRASGGLILDLAPTGIVFRSGVDQTRTNLGLGATWLTNSNSAAAAAALGQQLSTPIFLRTSSRDTSSNNAGGIVSALSFDGIHWSATRNYTIFPVFSRDASTIWHSNRWVSVYTDAFNATNKTFGVATSTNLLSWQTNFSVTLTGTNTTGTARNVWAPEWFVDGTNYYVLVRLSLSTNNNYGPPGVGWMRALDPGTWTNWTAWTPFDATIRTDANDFYIVKKDNLYWLFSHGGTHLGGSQPAGSNVVNNLTLQYSTNPFGNYSPMVEITEPLRAIIRPGNGSAFFEGPSVVNIEGPRWRLYFQDGLDNSAWCIDSFDDFATWNTNTLRRLQYSGFDGSGHGTVLSINATNQVGIRQAVLALGTGPTIGGSWLTNTNVTNFRTEIGALATNGSAAALTNFPTLNQNTTGTASNVTGVVALANGGTGASNQANARTNLGLGATWLTNSTAPLVWTNVPASPTNSGTAGQVAYSNNHLYICISNNTWRRVQLGTW